MRKSILAALLCTSAIAFPIQTTPVVVPGGSYIPTTAPGNTSLVSQARSEQTSYAQVGVAGDAGFELAQAVPNGQLVTPSVNGVPYFGDFLVTFTGFCAAADNTMRDGCTALVSANGSAPIILTQDVIDVALDNYRTGTRKVPGFKFLLKWTSALAAGLGTEIVINIELLPSQAMRDQGMAGRLMKLKMVCKQGYDVIATIDPTISGPGATAISGSVGQVFKSEGAFLSACAADQAAEYTANGKSLKCYYASYSTALALGTVRDVTAFSANAMSGSVGKSGRTMIDGTERKIVIASSNVITSTNNYTSNNALRPKYSGLDLKGFTFDLTNISNLSFGVSDGYDRFTRLIGCEIHGGPAGRYEVNAFTLQSLPSLVDSTTCLAYEQVYMHDMANRGDNNVTVMIGCYMQRMGKDAHNMASNRPHTYIATDCETHGDSFLNNPTAILDIAYSGPGTNVGYTITGTIGTATRTLTMLVDGQSVWSKPASLTANNSNGNPFSVDDLAADISANAPGFTVTRDAKSSNMPNLGYACLGFPFSEQGNSTTGDVTGVSKSGTFIRYTTGICVGAQSHTDFMQQTGTSNGNYDNILFLSCLGFDGFTSTIIYIATSGTQFTLSNWAVLNVGLNNNADYSFLGNTKGQIAASNVHLLLAHITQPSASMSFRFTGGSPNLMLDKFSRVGKIYCADFEVPGISSSTMQGIMADILVTHISTSPVPTSPGLTGVTDLKYPGSISSFTTTPSFDTDSFPALSKGLAILSSGVSTHFQPSDFKPATASRMRLPQNLAQPWLPVDVFGNPFAYGGKDLVGCVGLLSAAA